MSLSCEQAWWLLLFSQQSVHNNAPGLPLWNTLDLKLVRVCFFYGIVNSCRFRRFNLMSYPCGVILPHSVNPHWAWHDEHFVTFASLRAKTLPLSLDIATLQCWKPCELWSREILMKVIVSSRGHSKAAALTLFNLIQFYVSLWSCCISLTFHKCWIDYLVKLNSDVIQRYSMCDPTISVSLLLQNVHSRWHCFSVLSEGTQPEMREISNHTSCHFVFSV